MWLFWLLCLLELSLMIIDCRVCLVLWLMVVMVFDVGEVKCMLLCFLLLNKSWLWCMVFLGLMCIVGFMFG